MWKEAKASTMGAGGGGKAGSAHAAAGQRGTAVPEPPSPRPALRGQVAPRQVPASQRAPTGLPAPCQPTPQHQKQQETLRFSAFNLLWFEGLEKQGCRESVCSQSSSRHFVFPLSEWQAPGWRGRAAILLASAPGTALRGIDHPSRSPHGCGQPVRGRLTTDAIARHRRVLKPHHRTRLEMVESCSHSTATTNNTRLVPGPVRSLLLH